MASIPNDVEILPKISTGCSGRTNVTDDKQTTNERLTAYSERKREFPFAKNEPCATTHLLAYVYEKDDPFNAYKSFSLFSSRSSNSLYFKTHSVRSLYPIVALSFAQMQWLRVHCHIDYKIATLTYKVLAHNRLL